MSIRPRLARLRSALAKFLGSTVGHVAWAPPWRPEVPGSFMVRAVDDQGQADSRLIELAVVP